MGAQLSKVRGAFITRPRQRFNIEARAEKLLAKEEPKRAPRFDPDKEMLENIRQGNPEEIDVATKKDTDLLRKLEQVYCHPQTQIDLTLLIAWQRRHATPTGLCLNLVSGVH